MKFDISKNTLAHDRLLETLTNPRHRRIIENYRRHALLEVMGDWEGIFDPDMTVEEPRYRIEFGDLGGRWLVGEEVKDLYRGMNAVGANVIVVSKEKLAVHDDGFGSTAEYTQFYPGSVVREMGYEADDVNAWYAVTFFIVAFWPYDEECRMIGELGGATGPPLSIEKVDEADVITPQQAYEALKPLLRPLTPLVPVGGGAP